MLDLAPIRTRLQTFVREGLNRQAAADIAALLSEVAATRAELAAAQAAPVVEWRDNPRPGSVDTWVCHMGCMSLWVVVGFPADHRRRRGSGWWISVSGLGTLDSGPEAGPAGKAACEAAYRRACGLPASIAMQVIPLHQAYEGTTVCLHCGKPQPWPEMDRCPRDSGIPAIPACAG